MISTGSHGTGIRNQILASMVLEIELVTGSGDVILCSKEKESEIFKASLCSLGSFGIITKLTI
jgi:L-gulonolactone oxidase